jgi:hypothetical protein
MCRVVACCVKNDPGATSDQSEVLHLDDDDFKGIVDVQAAINRYLVENNAKPFVWIAGSDTIIEKVRHGKQALESIH